MSLWWTGNVVLVAVVVPVVVLLLTVLLRSALRLKQQCDAVAEHAEALSAPLGAWRGLEATRELAAQLGDELESRHGVGNGPRR